MFFDHNIFITVCSMAFNILGKICRQKLVCMSFCASSSHVYSSIESWYLAESEIENKNEVLSTLDSYLL